MLLQGGSYDLTVYTEAVRHDFSRSITKARYEKKYKLKKVSWKKYIDQDKALSILQVTQCAPVKKKVYFRGFLAKSKDLHAIEINHVIHIHPEILFRYVRSKMRKRLSKEVPCKEIRALNKRKGIR